MAEGKTKSTEESTESPAKRLKVDDEGLSNFEMNRILNSNIHRKQIFVQGTFKGSEDPAIVILEKKVFPQEELFLKRGFFNESTILRKHYQNDIYGKYECFPTREYNGLNVTVIYPATQKHIDKFLKKEEYLIEETEEIYKEITLPCIESQQFSLQWVDNILAHKAETDSIIFEDLDKEIGFIMLPDLKWDGQVENLNLLVLPFQRIRSIRELTEAHLPLLKNMKKRVMEVVPKKYKIPSSHLRMYFHYQPSYYHLHVHVSHIRYESGVYAEKAHLLTTVMNNLEMKSDYYQKATLTYVVYQGDFLQKKFVEAGILQDSAA